MIYTLTLNPAIDRELTVDKVEYDRVLSALEARVDLGGKGFNVSRMLMSLGTISVAVGFVGGNTDLYLTALNHALVEPLDRLVGLCIIGHLDKSEPL